MISIPYAGGDWFTALQSDIFVAPASDSVGSLRTLGNFIFTLAVIAEGGLVCYGLRVTDTHASLRDSVWGCGNLRYLR
ncbi:hypothetical protein BS17DRAFT_780522 [Gyrodon lividus]|nr:hypothetical protein BS17DRAFT_780522 [Gyrodon lividus]